MSRLILALLIALTPALNLGCGKDSDKVAQDSTHNIGEFDLYTFVPDDYDFLSGARPFVLPAGTSVMSALERLGQDLAKNYFSTTYTDKATDIHFDVLGVTEIATPSRSLRIAVINMVDTKRDGITYFFQGSTGAQTTFYMLAATFTQPHLNPPLLDGLVFLYNGETLPELDHISLTGILVPKTVEHAVRRAIHGHKRKAGILKQNRSKGSSFHSDHVIVRDGEPGLAFFLKRGP